MDSRHFDALARVLSTTDSRRGVVAALAALPVFGGLLGSLHADETEAAGRRKRRKKAHKHGKGRRRKHKPGKQKQPACTPDSRATTCTGKCGTVTNTCQQAVDCGSCVCDPPCGICQTCDAQTGQCVPDALQKGDTCGGTGQRCQADGTCSCDATSCPVCRSCHRSGECTNPCSSAGCCDGVTCQPGTSNDACGNGGVTCEVCTGQEQCTEYENNEFLCTCVPDCAGKTCGDDGCGDSCGHCFGTLPICADGICVPCSSENPCANGCCQDDGTCDVTCRVFASSTLQQGDFGGLAEGDAICQGLADAAGFPGLFMAWLSDDSDSPSTRFPLAGSPRVGPYAMVGTPVASIADSWQDLITCEGNACLDVALTRTDTGGSVTTNAWTATNTDGTAHSDTCANWTIGDSSDKGLTGHSVDYDSRWTNSLSQSCGIAFHLYCFQQG